ncbi:hypothetical protein [Aliarcobacter butzleri]|uniref:hypothetical protein n=1 Tax=Aliarcobacter butzleri TaxID=28197 RepID=UPI0021B1FB48|nr:hypothetical protein [Aliarcobacter butzleri]MCT7648942.1 hypothetical protein [Aliarcobacter butzleri]
MKNELQKLTKEQLLELVEHFEHYPSVTEEDDKAYILAYIEDEACTISEEQILNYLLKTIIVEISEDNIHLYYKFMNKENISKYRDILHTFFNKRHPLNIEDFLEIDKEVIKDNWKYNCFADGKIKTQSYFGIKDTLKPIDEYIEEIKESEQYKIFTSECRCNNCMTYFESEDDLHDAEDEDGEFKACPECNTDAYLMDLADLK